MKNEFIHLVIHRDIVPKNLAHQTLINGFIKTNVDNFRRVRLIDSAWGTKSHKWMVQICFATNDLMGLLRKL